MLWDLLCNFRREFGTSTSNRLNFQTKITTLSLSKIIGLTLTGGNVKQQNCGFCVEMTAFIIHQVRENIKKGYVTMCSAYPIVKQDST